MKTISLKFNPAAKLYNVAWEFEDNSLYTFTNYFQLRQHFSTYLLFSLHGALYVFMKECNISAVPPFAIGTLQCLHKCVRIK